jgi:hyaluronan synthase
MVFSRLELTWVSFALALAWLVVGRGIRGISHLVRHPGEIVLLPLVTFVVICIALPIKLYAFLTMNRQGWLTRSSATVGGEGQDERSLARHRRPHPQPAASAEPSAARTVTAGAQ